MRTNLTNATFLLMESRDRPMHVATLLIYSLPAGAGPDFVQNLVARLRNATEFVAPFNLRLTNPNLRLGLPMWVEDRDLDLEYHVRHLALPYPGGERELGVLVSNLHSNPLDFNRPLWAYYIIEGLAGNRFAVYFKMHHALVDGLAGVRMLQRSMSTRQQDVDTPALWSARHEAGESSPTPATDRWDVVDSLGDAARSVRDVGTALIQLAQSAFDSDDPARLPFQAPVSILNHRIHGARRFATQTYDFARIRVLARQGNCTINDIVLALCSGALRRFLKELGALPGRSLTAGIPVALRAAEDHDSSPAVAFVIADLATHIANPERRLAAIAASTRRAKAMMQGMARENVEKLNAALMMPYALQMLVGLEGRTRPVFNLTISNVPGPREYLYFHGARLEAMYPVSAVTHGQALNITCYSYADTLSFGFAGCRKTLPRMQRLAVYTGEALEELERVLLKSQVKVAAPAAATTRTRSGRTPAKRRRTNAQA
jgi:WS/DGAT/MGAT family acyltransferase